MLLVDSKKKNDEISRVDYRHWKGKKKNLGFMIAV